MKRDLEGERAFVTAMRWCLVAIVSGAVLITVAVWLLLRWAGA
jgi:hypothetical protein